VIDFNGQRVQIMHEGSRVVADGYCGNWMTRIIKSLRGHHEPQEELVFHHILKLARPGSLIMECGSFWAYYTNWFLGFVPDSCAVCVEPDENHLECGRRNLELNGRTATFINACIGGQHIPSILMRRESDGQEVEMTCQNMNSLLGLTGDKPVEVLHIDAQGAELSFLRSAREAAARGHLRFIVVSTHHESISGSPFTHQDCLAELRRMGATILAEHSVEESFSGDGLIAASCYPEDRNIFLPSVSINKPERSLFGPAQPTRVFNVAHTRFGSLVVSSRDQVISRMLLERGNFEEAKIEEVVQFLAVNFAFMPETFVDLGANIGTHIVSAMASGRFSRGIAIEMEEANFELLQANVAINHLGTKTQLFHAALSNVCARGRIELSDENFGDHRIRNDDFFQDGKFGEHKRSTTDIVTTTLDDFVTEEGLNLGSGALIWMDTQGHEGHVLAGGRATFSNGKSPYVVVEMWPYGIERSGGRDLFFEFLDGCAAIYDINSENWAKHPFLSAKVFSSLYDQMLASSAAHEIHTDLLCIRRNR
jgi:FkbM family methyltransferase